jgi:hypothetical protein
LFRQQVSFARFLLSYTSILMICIQNAPWAWSPSSNCVQQNAQEMLLTTMSWMWITWSVKRCLKSNTERRRMCILFEIDLVHKTISSSDKRLATKHV